MEGGEGVTRMRSLILDKVEAVVLRRIVFCTDMVRVLCTCIWKTVNFFPSLIPNGESNPTAFSIWISKVYKKNSLKSNKMQCIHAERITEEAGMGSNYQVNNREIKIFKKKKKIANRVQKDHRLMLLKSIIKAAQTVGTIAQALHSRGPRYTHTVGQGKWRLTLSSLKNGGHTLLHCS